MTRKISREELKARMCPNCGGELTVEIEEALAKCQYCGMGFDIPVSDDIRKEYIKSKNRMRDEKKREQIVKEEKAKEKRKEKNAIIGQLVAVVAALVVLVISVIMDKTGYNGTMIELAGIIAMIAAAAALVRKNASFVEYAISAVGGALTIILSLFLENGSMLELGGGIAIIVVVVNFARSFFRNNE